jgi:hypothetical protein
MSNRANYPPKRPPVQSDAVSRDNFYAPQQYFEDNTPSGGTLKTPMSDGITWADLPAQNGPSSSANRMGASDRAHANGHVPSTPASSKKVPQNEGPAATPSSSRQKTSRLLEATYAKLREERAQGQAHGASNTTATTPRQAANRSPMRQAEGGRSQAKELRPVSMPRMRPAPPMTSTPPSAEIRGREPAPNMVQLASPPLPATTPSVIGETRSTHAEDQFHAAALKQLASDLANSAPNSRLPSMQTAPFLSSDQQPSSTPSFKEISPVKAVANEDNSVVQVFENRVKSLMTVRLKVNELSQRLHVEEDEWMRALKGLLSLRSRERAEWQAEKALLEAQLRNATAQLDNAKKELNNNEQSLEAFRVEGSSLISRLRSSLASMTENYRREVEVNAGLSAQLEEALRSERDRVRRRDGLLGASGGTVDRSGNGSWEDQALKAMEEEEENRRRLLQRKREELRALEEQLVSGLSTPTSLKSKSPHTQSLNGSRDREDGSKKEKDSQDKNKDKVKEDREKSKSKSSKKSSKSKDKESKDSKEKEREKEKAALKALKSEIRAEKDRRRKAEKELSKMRESIHSNEHGRGHAMRYLHEGGSASESDNDSNNDSESVASDSAATRSQEDHSDSNDNGADQSPPATSHRHAHRSGRRTSHSRRGNSPDRDRDRQRQRQHSRHRQTGGDNGDDERLVRDTGASIIQQYREERESRGAGYESPPESERGGAQTPPPTENERVEDGDSGLGDPMETESDLHLPSAVAAAAPSPPSGKTPVLVEEVSLKYERILQEEEAVIAALKERVSASERENEALQEKLQAEEAAKTVATSYTTAVESMEVLLRDSLRQAEEDVDLEMASTDSRQSVGSSSQVSTGGTSQQGKGSGKMKMNAASERGRKPGSSSTAKNTGNGKEKEKQSHSHSHSQSKKQSGRSDLRSSAGKSASLVTAPASASSNLHLPPAPERKYDLNKLKEEMNSTIASLTASIKKPSGEGSRGSRARGGGIGPAFVSDNDDYLQGEQDSVEEEGFGAVLPSSASWHSGLNSNRNSTSKPRHDQSHSQSNLLSESEENAAAPSMPNELYHALYGGETDVVTETEEGEGVAL